MDVTVKHSLPGRLRVRYDKNKIGAHQAAVAQSLLLVQEGMNDVSVNPTLGSFLLYYDSAILSVKKILALFRAISDRYLTDEQILASVPAPVKRESLAETLFVMIFTHYAKTLLPQPVRFLFNVFNLAPRILKGTKLVASGSVFKADVLDAAAITAALLSGDTATALNVNFLLNIGETIEEFTKKKSYSDLTDAILSENDDVHLVVGETERKVPAKTLKIGDIAAVRTGFVIPADGEVIKGEALVNQSALTGEPLAVEKRSGASVFAGTVVQEGELFVRVRALGSQTKVKNILKMIDSSQQSKISSQVRSERLADYLVRYNFLISALTYLLTGSVTKLLATLMVDYSCAMKLTAPISVLSAMKEAAGEGIIIKGGKFLEDVSKADAVVFDKTGTLTQAEPHLSRVIAFGKNNETDILRTAACLEEHFAHPVANAIVKAAAERGIEHPEKHAKVEYIVAHGIATTLNGKKLFIGSRHFIFDDEHIEKPANLDAVQRGALEKGESLLYLADEDGLLGVFAVTDTIRPDAAKVVSLLRSDGIKECVMITGDDEGAAKTAAEAAGIERYISRALPDDKIRCIEDGKQRGKKVIMIGDGINDAPAIAAADVGIAMGESAAITGETADIILPAEGGLEALYKTRILGKRLVRRVDVNNRAIITVNSLLIAAGLFGLVPPSVAALLHNASTVLFSVYAAAPLLDKKE